MSAYYSSSPVLYRDEFVYRFKAHGGSYDMPLSIAWLIQAQTKYNFYHGGVILKEGATHCDVGSYLSCANPNKASRVDLIAKHYGVDQNSTLVIKETLTVNLIPYYEDKDDIEHNKGRTNGPYHYHELPPGLPVINGVVSQQLAPILIGSAEIWSSKNTALQNAEILEAVKGQYCLTNIIDEKERYIASILLSPEERDQGLSL